MGAAPIREIRQETVSMSKDHLDSFALLDDKMVKWLLISEIIIAKRSAERTCHLFLIHLQKALRCRSWSLQVKGSKQNVGEIRMDTTAWWHIKVTQVEITSTLSLWTLSKLRLKALLLYKLKAVVGIIRIRLESKKCETLPLLGCCSTSATWILPIANGNHRASSIFKAQRGPFCCHLSSVHWCQSMRWMKGPNPPHSKDSNCPSLCLEWHVPPVLWSGLGFREMAQTPWTSCNWITAWFCSMRCGVSLWFIATFPM